MALPTVTLLYAGCLGLLMTLLGMNVTRLRATLKVAADAPIPKAMHLAVRAHANASEWTPMLVVLLALVELSGGASRQLHLAGGLLLAGRLLHALGFLTKAKTSALGITLVWAVGLWLPVWALLLHFGH